MKGKARILIVDDDEDICRTLSLILEEKGYEVDAAHTGKEAIEKSKTKVYNAALLDIKLPDMEGTELLTAMRETSPKMIKIMVTGYPALKNAAEALNKGADAYLMKPVNPEKLIKTIEEKLKIQKEAEVMTQEKIAAFVKTRTEKLLQESQ
ncbi:response regulator [Candidatus Bathyarchaeota archaeon]|nr:response regulator [Candidatus Bathyarchaeota archaeon]